MRQDGVVGILHADFQRTPHIGGLGRGARLGQPACHFRADEGGGHAAGNFSGVVAAHTVRQYGDLRFAIDRHRIFVVGAHPALVGSREKFVGHGCVGERHWAPETGGADAPRTAGGSITVS